MLTKIIAFSVKNKLIIGLLVLALIGIGIYETSKLPIDAVPDITNNQVQVITTAPSFGATDIERLITFPIEQANSNISGLKEIRSFSRFGLSLVTIVFDDGVDIYWARQQVAERLQQAKSEIPAGIGTPELGPISTGLGEIYQYVVRPKKGYENKYSITELRTIQDWIVRRQLIGVKGVAEVSSFGGRLKQYEVALNPDKLNAYGITIQDVFDALEKNNQNTGGAYIEKGPTALFIRSEGLVGNIDDIQNIAIEKKDLPTPLFIRDVADVHMGYATRYGALCYNDQGEVSGAVVMMLKNANSSEVIKNVKAKVAEIQKTLPEGVVIEPFLDRTKMVNNAISTVEHNLMEGAIIVIFVLVLFLGNFRAGLLVASVIPLAMLFAICMMNIFGVSGNLMSLGALDFGLIIDGAVIIVESVMHLLSHNARYQQMTKLSQKEMDATVVTSASRMMNSAVFGQIIILIVYLPIFSLQGIEGKMFKPMAQTVAFALLGAFLLSLTYVPMMSTLVLSKKIAHKPNFAEKWMGKVEKVYRSLLLKVVRIPKLIFAIVFCLFIIAVYVLSRMGGEFIPSLEEGDFAVETRVLTGSNLNTTIEYTQKAAHILKSRFPEVEKVVSKIGSGEVPTDPMPMEACDMMVILKDKSLWTSAHTFPELADTMTKALQDVPGITVSFQYPVQMRFNELMTGARQDVVVKVFGENLDTLVQIADKLGKIVNTVNGTQSLYVEPVAGMPQVIIRYDRLAIAQYHLNIEDVNRVINAAFAGQSTGQVFEGEKRFDMVVRMPTENRKNINDVRNLLVPTPAGNQIPLSQLASVNIEDGPNQIQRENAQRRITVGFNIHGRDVQSIVQELQNKVQKQVKLPSGYYITYGGSFENLNQAKSRLMIAVPVALVLIFLLLYLAFNSLKEGLLIYTAIPLSIIGGVFLLAWRGMPFSISAGIGFIALFGVAVLNGIVLIAEFNRLRKNGIKNIVRIVVDGTESRLRPVLMTACVASLGFLPMALSNGAGGQVQRPLATVVIGGLMIATLLTLFVLPLLYISFEKGFKKKKKKMNTHFIGIMLIAAVAGFIPSGSNAQEHMSLDQVLSIAVANNQGLKSEKLRTELAKSMSNTATEIPKTDFSAEFGQINSAYSDYKFSVSQSFAFPSVYKKQRDLYDAEWKKSLLNVSLKEQELKKAVSLTYFDIIYWQSKEQLLQRADSLYSAFYDKAALRLQQGESNVLEKTTAESQLAAIKMQLQQVRSELQTSLLQLQWLANSEQMIYPIASTVPQLKSVSPDSLSENPALQLLQQETEIADRQIEVAKSKLLPEWQVGYNLNSFKGIGPNEVYYNAVPRFHSGQIGIAVPIFASGQKAKIKSAQLALRVADADVATAKGALNVKMHQLWSSYQVNKKIASENEQLVKKNAQAVLTTAQRQFADGEINYMEFVMLVNQTIVLQNNYLDALRNLHQNIIQLQFLTLNP